MKQASTKLHDQPLNYFGAHMGDQLVRRQEQQRERLVRIERRKAQKINNERNNKKTKKAAQRKTEGAINGEGGRGREKSAGAKNKRACCELCKIASVERHWDISG